jgi:Iap family predicted aminopeptidase
MPTRIDRQLVTGHLRALQRIADRGGGSRAAGTRGYRDSARYVANTLRDAGWTVRVQRFSYPGWAERSSALAIAPGGALRHGRDFRPAIYSGAGRADGPLRAVGTGCAQEELSGIRPGEVALAMPAGCLFRVKALNARRAGAAALLIGDPTRARRGASTVTLVAPGVGLPVAIVRRALAERLRDGSRVRIRVGIVAGRRSSVNVIGQSPGRGPRVAMAGAHLDSVPAGPGINDNGSGVAALLAVAQTAGRRPAETPLRLGFWGAEELGLYGSRRYVRSLESEQVRSIGAYLNLDMVGSPNPVRAVYGAGQARRPARAAARRIARLLRARVRPKETTGGASDHVAFASAGVPVGGVFTGASGRGPGGRPRDPCYHLACDRLANVNVGELAELARATASTLAVLARQAK